MFRPTLPDPPPVITSQAVPLIASAPHSHAPACSCSHVAPVPSRRLAPLVGIGAGAVAAVVAVGVVLTALLATVAITAVAVSIAALVLRSLLSGTTRR